jgi:hypothetical protein
LNVLHIGNRSPAMPERPAGLGVDHEDAKAGARALLDGRETLACEREPRVVGGRRRPRAERRDRRRQSGKKYATVRGNEHSVPLE